MNTILGAIKLIMINQILFQTLLSHKFKLEQLIYIHFKILVLKLYENRYIYILHNK